MCEALERMSTTTDNVACNHQASLITSRMTKAANAYMLMHQSNLKADQRFLAKHAFGLLCLPLHESNWPKNVALVGVDNVPVHNRFGYQKMHLLELVHDIKSGVG